MNRAIGSAASRATRHRTITWAVFVPSMIAVGVFSTLLLSLEIDFHGVGTALITFCFIATLALRRQENREPEAGSDQALPAVGGDAA